MALPNELSVNLGLPQAPLTSNPELSVELQRVYNAIRTLANALDSYSGVLKESAAYYSQLGTSKVFAGMNSRFYLVAGEALTFGNLIGVNATTGQAHKAQDGVLQAIGFCSTVGNTPAGSQVEIQLFGMYPAYPSDVLTPGATVYNTSTAGVLGVKAAAPAWEQPVGIALTRRNVYFNPQYVKI